MSAAPIFLLAGGRSSLRAGRDPLLTRALAAAGAPHPSLAYVGSASDDNRAFFTMISGFLRLCGAGRVTLVPTAGRRFDRAKAQAILEAADIVFVSGGDVEAGMDLLNERDLTGQLRELHAAGKPFLGVSAGSIMIGSRWVRWEDPDDDATAALFPCLGLAPLVCDTHAEDDGWEELRMFLSLSSDGSVAYGIPSGGGLRVDSDGSVEALGAPACRFARRSGRAVREDDLEVAG